MKPRKFVSELLRMVRANFPELYKQSIKGRHEQIIAECQVPALTFEFAGKRIGRVGKDLQLLFALGMLFRKQALEEEERNPRAVADGKIRGSSEACQEICVATTTSIGVLCIDAFWKMVDERFDIPRKRDFSLVLQSDWSLEKVAAETVPEEAKCTDYDMLLDLIEVQANASRFALYAKRCADKLTVR